MKGRYYLVLLLGLLVVFMGTNYLAYRYNQLAGQNIPGVVEVSQSADSYGVKFLGSGYNLKKEELSKLWLQIKEWVPIEEERLRQLGLDIIQKGEGLLGQAVEMVRELTGQQELREEPELRDKGDLV